MSDKWNTATPTFSSATSLRNPGRDGQTSFTHLAIRVLDPHYAIATGNFHLERSKEGGGNADGIFSLLWSKDATGWKIILDHTGRLN